MRAVSIAIFLFTLTSTAYAQRFSPQCMQIPDGDRREYCKATSGGGSHFCGGVKDLDLRAMCRAESGEGSAQCMTIKNLTMRAECQAKAKKR